MTQARAPNEKEPRSKDRGPGLLPVQSIAGRGPVTHPSGRLKRSGNASKNKSAEAREKRKLCKDIVRSVRTLCQLYHNAIKREIAQLWTAVIENDEHVVRLAFITLEIVGVWFLIHLEERASEMAAQFAK